MPTNSAKARYETKPTPNSKTWQRPILAASKRLGTPPLPWQKKAIRLLGELRPATAEEKDQFGPVVAQGVPRYRQVIVSVPRQSGKTTLSRAAITAKAESENRLDLWGTAQTRGHALDHQKDLAELLREVDFTSGAGRETIAWPNGSTYRIFAPNKKGGHGASVDLGLIDEAWSLTSEVLGGIIPAMAARPLSQLLIISTMGTAESVTWNGLRDAGRESVDNPDATMAYVEYSAPNEEAVFDPSRWGEWMPALGYTISRASIESDMRLMEADPSLGRAEIVRAYGNLTTSAKITVFPTQYLERAWRVITPPERFVLTVDVNDTPAGAAVSTGHVYSETDPETEAETTGTAVRMTEWQFGSPHWVPARVKEMIAHRKVEAVVGDFGGPAKQIEAELSSICESAFVPLVNRQPRELAADTLSFYNALRDGEVALERSESLREAFDGAVRKPIGDMWVVARSRMSVDASPLVSVILAHGVASELRVRPKVEPELFVSFS